MKKNKTIAWIPSMKPATAARRELLPLARRYFSEGREATGAKTSAEKLHWFRLRTKRFRYTLELFRPLYGPGLEARLAMLRRIQQYLGEINDCTSMRALFAPEQSVKSPRSEQLLSSIDALAAEKTKEFLRYWRETFDAPDQEQRWLRYLRDFAGRARPAGRGKPSGAKM